MRGENTMPTTTNAPLPLNQHILTDINELNSLGNWEFVCFIAGISPDTALDDASLLTVMNSIAVLHHERGQEEITPVSNAVYADMLGELGYEPEEALNWYANFLREQIVRGNGEYSVHRKSNMSTLVLNPEVTVEEMSKEKLTEFNETAMRHYYYTLETEAPENEQENPENEQNAPKLDDDGLANILNALNDLFSGKEISAQSDAEPKDTAAEGSENKVDEISESEAAENPDPQNWAESSDDDFFEDSDNEMSESSESERSYSSDSENSYSSDSDTYSSSSSDSSEDEKEEEKEAEEKQDEEPKRKPRRTPLYFRPGMFKDSDSSEDEREEKKPRKVKTVIKGPESSESSDEEEFRPKKRKRPINTFSSEDEIEKPESSAKAPAESDEHEKPKNAETQEEREARQDRENLAAEHRAFMQRGIGLDEFNSFRFDRDADMSDEHLKGMKFIQRLTGVRLNENSTYDDCISALDKLIINGKSAYEYFGLANEPKDMTAIDNKVLPGLTRAGIMRATAPKRLLSL